MNDNPNDETQINSGATSEHGARPPHSTSEIPRRGYDRRRDATGSLRPPMATPPSSAPPRYEAPPAYPPPRYGPKPGTPPPPTRGGHRAPRDSGLYLPWWSLLILIVFVGAAAFGLVVVVANLSGAALLEQTPQVVIVTGQLQPTPVQQNAAPPTAITSPQPTPAPNLPTAAPSRTPLPGDCLLNDEMIVYGTGGVGLNLRDEPGGEVAFIAKEGERVLVIDGPQFFNGKEWCQVRSTGQSSAFGWAVMDFLIAAEALDNTATPQP